MSQIPATPKKIIPVKSSAPKTPQTTFVEEMVREGYSVGDVQMWQYLCRELCVLKAGSEETMYGLLTLADIHGIHPLQLVNECREHGEKKLDENSVSLLVELFNNVPSTSEAEFVADEASDDEIKASLPVENRDEVEDDEAADDSTEPAPKRVNHFNGFD